MFNIDLAIKFGGNEISVFRKGFGIVAKEPAYLAVVENGNKIKVKATGKVAEKMFHTSSSDITVHQPIENGVIVDEKMAVLLLSQIIKNAIPDKFLLKSVSALVAVPCALNEIQLKQIKNVLLASGVGKVTFVPNAVCVRANLEIDTSSHLLVVDIGKYLTDICVLNNENIVKGRMYFVGGNDMDKSITTFIQDNHNLEVSDQTSEAIKNEVASLYERDLYKTEYIGINENNKFVKQEITANEIRVAIVNVYDSIFNLINETINSLPKELVAEVYSNGVVFVGGGSCVAGLYEYAKKKLDIPVIVPEDAMDNVILGAGKLLNNGKDFLKIEL